MECRILFMGPVGSGKTEAIRSMSDITPVDTDVVDTDDIAFVKNHTSVSMELGTMHLGGVDKLRLLGAPGQTRFDYMWDILLKQSQGVILTINHRAKAPLLDLESYLLAVEQRCADRRVPIVVCITHMEGEADLPLQTYTKYLAQRGCTTFDVLPPVIEMDARKEKHVRSALLTMTALLEMHSRFPTLRTYH